MTPARNYEATLTIERVDQEARGIARLEGFVWIVPGALPGEIVRARVIKPGARYAVARVMDIISPSPERIEPRCAIASRCGGCVWQHARYEASLAYKQAHVSDCLTRIGGINRPTVGSIIGMTNPWNYRNKGSFPVSGISSAPRIGFYAARSHDVIDAPCGCLLQTDTSNRLIAAAREWMRANRVDPYDERTHRGLIRHIVTRVNSRGDAMLTIVTNDNRADIECGGDLVERLRGAAPSIAGVSVSPNNRPGNVIFGETCETIWGSPILTETLDTIYGELQFDLSPRSFFQVNTAQAGRLVDTMLEYAQPSPACRVADVYCGAGALSLALAKTGADVKGIEIVSDAVNDARRNAARNGLPYVRFQCGDAVDLLPKLIETDGRFDLITLDPPRKGCERAVLEAAALANPKRIVYISCDPATLARDASILRDLGYAFVKAQPIDQFCWTSAVETVALFAR
ncbi:MAG: 23S rRNA (uracil(1939)-C(5))-methyltransferase RlmD [Oscillospiraceae bacterium]|jgi:23S rRNA (uracil1939-C5)-methyltransferase|nr:23S rRNA (uracil(1939)-C(5))-methyltransferase RlmD [Oscillospiraceae bacterium]